MTGDVRRIIGIIFFLLRRLGPNAVYIVGSPSGLRLLARFRLGLSHLRAHNFSQDFSNCLNHEFAELISNLETLSFFNAHYIYPKDKHLWRKPMMLRFQFLIKMKIAFVILYFLVAIKMTLKTFAYSIKHLNISYQQKALKFLFE